MHDSPTFEMRVSHVHCIDVNDGGLNGHTDHIFIREHVSGINDTRGFDLGKYKNGTKREPKKLLISPKIGSTYKFKVIEDDTDNFSGDDLIGAFTVSTKGKVKAGKNAKIVTPASAPANHTVLALNGSGAKYRITLVLRAAPPATST